MNVYTDIEYYIVEQIDKITTHTILMYNILQQYIYIRIDKVESCMGYQ